MYFSCKDLHYGFVSVFLAACTSFFATNTTCTSNVQCCAQGGYAFNDQLELVAAGTSDSHGVCWSAVGVRPVAGAAGSCQAQPAGKPCVNNWECGSGSCNTATKVCEKAADGFPCVVSAGCMSGNCVGAVFTNNVPTAAGLCQAAAGK